MNKRINDILGQQLVIAAKPMGNPRDISVGSLMLTLIDHDYEGITPIMWNAAYKAVSIKAQSVMVVADPAQSTEILAVFAADERYLGGGVGSGFKDEVIKHLDELDPLAKAIGAVNVITRTASGKLRGFNTDGIGYADGLETLLSQSDWQIAGTKILILGAGGTANAIALTLAERGARLVILNRTVAKAKALADRVNSFVGSKLAQAYGEDAISSQAQWAQVIVNVSTKGATGTFARYSALAPALTPVSDASVDANLSSATQVIASLAKSVIVSDINLTEEPTPTLVLAAQHGLTTQNGIAMVVNQGVSAFWLVHGSELDARGISQTEIAQVMSQAAGLRT